MISRIYSGFVLLFAIATALATSSPSYQRAFAIGTYQVKSDCPNAQAEGQLTIAYEDTTFPIREDVFTLNDGMAFGFPSNQLVGGESNGPKQGNKVTVQEGERTCKAVLWETENNSGLFVCHRGENVECTIHLQKI